MSSSDYAALNLDPIDNPTESDIRQAYKKLALLLHPDKNLEDPTSAKTSFQNLQDAYENIMRGFVSEDGGSDTKGETNDYSEEMKEQMREQREYMQSIFNQANAEQDRLREDLRILEEKLRQEQEEHQRLMMAMAAMHNQQARGTAHKLNFGLNNQDFAFQGVRSTRNRNGQPFNGRTKTRRQRTKEKKQRTRFQTVAASGQQSQDLGVQGGYQGEVFCEIKVIVEAFEMMMEYED